MLAMDYWRRIALDAKLDQYMSAQKPLGLLLPSLSSDNDQNKKESMPPNAQFSPVAGTAALALPMTANGGRPIEGINEPPTASKATTVTDDSIRFNEHPHTGVLARTFSDPSIQSLYAIAAHVAAIMPNQASRTTVLDTPILNALYNNRSLNW